MSNVSNLSPSGFSQSFVALELGAMSFDDNEKEPSGEDVLSPVSDIKRTADQRQVLRKLDFRLLPFVCLLFVLSFL